MASCSLENLYQSRLPLVVYVKTFVFSGCSNSILIFTYLIFERLIHFLTDISLIVTVPEYFSHMYGGNMNFFFHEIL